MHGLRKAFCLGIQLTHSPSRSLTPRQPRPHLTHSFASAYRPSLLSLPLSQTSTSSTFHHQLHPLLWPRIPLRVVNLSARPFLVLPYSTLFSLPRTAIASFRDPLVPLYSWPRLALQAAASLTFHHPPRPLALSSSSLLLSLHSSTTITAAANRLQSEYYPSSTLANQSKHSPLGSERLLRDSL